MIQFFIIFGLIFGPIFWDIFSISGNAIMNHFLSIVVSCKKAKNGFCEVLQIRCTFLLKASIFYNFWHSFGAQSLRYLLNFRKCAYESLFQHRNILQKREKRLLSGFADPMNLFIKCSIFHHFCHSFGTRVWDIFSISGNALMNHFFCIVISCKKAKNASVWFRGSDAPFH